MKRIHVYYHNSNGKKDDIIYDADAIKAGPARDVLGPDDARGNGIPLNAPLIQIIMPDGGTATFNADNITILL